jgi:ubiquinone/menaquinone biosynthesis C-methylase UbiE
LSAGISTFLRRFRKDSGPDVLDPASGYDLWASTYDEESGNVVLTVERTVFSDMLGRTDLEDKAVLDVGCGTGRHWAQILQTKPATLSGYDVSIEMISRLRQKFPYARAFVLRECKLHKTPDASIDVLVSTLVLAHIPDLQQALSEWNRVLKPHADILVTDFHPAALDKGAKRTFRHDGRLLAVESHVYPLADIRRIADELRWKEVEFVEVKVDETIESYYSEQQAQALYERFRDVPIVYGLRLKKT